MWNFLWCFDVSRDLLARYKSCFQCSMKLGKSLYGRAASSNWSGYRFCSACCDPPEETRCFENLLRASSSSPPSSSSSSETPPRDGAPASVAQMWLWDMLHYVCLSKERRYANTKLWTVNWNGFSSRFLLEQPCVLPLFHTSNRCLPGDSRWPQWYQAIKSNLNSWFLHVWSPLPP